MTKEKKRKKNITRFFSFGLVCGWLDKRVVYYYRCTTAKLAGGCFHWDENFARTTTTKYNGYCVGFCTRYILEWERKREDSIVVSVRCYIIYMLYKHHQHHCLCILIRILYWEWRYFIDKQLPFLHQRHFTHSGDYIHYYNTCFILNRTSCNG